MKMRRNGKRRYGRKYTRWSISTAGASDPAAEAFYQPADKLSVADFEQLIRERHAVLITNLTKGWAAMKVRIRVSLALFWSMP